MAKDKDLPVRATALWYAMRLAYRFQPALLVLSIVVTVLAMLPSAVSALWLKFLADGLLSHRDGLVRLGIAGLAFSSAGSWVLGVVSQRVHMRFRDRATIEIEAHVARLQATVEGVEHHERPEYLDRLQLLRDQAFLLNHIYGSAFGTLGSLAQLIFTVVLLVTIHPALVALVVFAVPPVIVATWRAGKERKVEESSAPYRRLARHLFDLGTTPGPGKEIRVEGNANDLRARLVATRERYLNATGPVRWVSAVWHAAAWTLFGVAYMGAIVFVAAGLHASPGSVLLALAAGGRLTQYIGSTVGEADFFRWCIDASQRLLWLERYAAAHVDKADAPIPDRIERGIRLERVSFRYPGTDAWVLREVDLELPAGSVVAVVGENGAGKTSLMKLISRMYAPTEGRVTIDGVDLARLPAEPWRERLAGAFQDFVRFEFLARRTVGIGDLPRMDDRGAVVAAVERGGATDVIEKLPNDIDTQLGPTWNDGVEVSFGQWQKLALARGLMRDDPLVVILDEPTASLDAETEHALFERFAATSRTSSQDGRITLLVSHRFSTVRMADLIVVLDHGRLAEFGSHDDLVAKRGLYAELYEIQASAYR